MRSASCDNPDLILVFTPAAKVECNFDVLKRTRLMMLTALITGIATAGCNGSAQRAPKEPAKPLIPQQVQSQTMAFASRFITATVDTYSEIQLSETTPEAQLTALRRKIVAAYGAIGCAVEFNPLVGLMDLTVMITLSREIAEKPWNVEIFGPDNAAKIVAMLKQQENEVWGLVTPYLTPAQITELHDVCQQWLRDNPDVAYPINVGLADLQVLQTPVRSSSSASSLFGLMGLDPLAGLDPTRREIEQSRILAERISFEVRHLPMLLSWQANSLYLQVLANPQTKRFLDDTSKLADAVAGFAHTVEEYRTQLPAQQDKLVEQLNLLIATQRESALDQATTQISVHRDEIIRQLNATIAAEREAAFKEATMQVSLQRDETIRQLNAIVAAQQEVITQHLRGTMESLIDSLYQRARTLLFIAAGAILTVLLIYRLTARSISRTGERRSHLFQL